MQGIQGVCSANQRRMLLSRSPTWTYRDGSPSRSVDYLGSSSQRSLFLNIARVEGFCYF